MLLQHLGLVTMVMCDGAASTTPGLSLTCAGVCLACLTVTHTQMVCVVYAFCRVWTPCRHKYPTVLVWHQLPLCVSNGLLGVTSAEMSYMRCREWGLELTQSATQLPVIVAINTPISRATTAGRRVELHLQGSQKKVEHSEKKSF